MKKRKWNSGFGHGAGIPLEYIDAPELDDKERLDAGFNALGTVRPSEFWDADMPSKVAPVRKIAPGSEEGRKICARLGVRPSVLVKWSAPENSDVFACAKQK
jgi:hypothetical protein